MKTKNNGKEYESIVFQVYTTLCRDERLTSVERDVKILGPDGDRQIDVLVKHSHAGVEYVTAIECRDYAGKLTVTHVDAFVSKIADINASKGILVSRKGFSKTAEQKAKRLGIGLCIVDNADKLLKKLVVEVPIIIKVIQPTLHCQTLMKNNTSKEKKVLASAWTTINDIPLHKLVIQDLRNGSIEIPDESKTLEWATTTLEAPFYIRDTEGEKIEIPWFKVTLRLDIWHLFGHTNHLPDFVSQTTIGESIHNFFIPDRFKVELNSSFSRYEKRSEIPYNYNDAIIGLFTPEPDGSIASTHEAWSFFNPPSSS